MTFRACDLVGPVDGLRFTDASRGSLMGVNARVVWWRQRAYDVVQFGTWGTVLAHGVP